MFNHVSFISEQLYLCSSFFQLPYLVPHILAHGTGKHRAKPGAFRCRFRRRRTESEASAAAAASHATSAEVARLRKECAQLEAYASEHRAAGLRPAAVHLVC